MSLIKAVGGKLKLLSYSSAEQMATSFINASVRMSIIFLSVSRKAV